MTKSVKFNAEKDVHLRAERGYWFLDVFYGGELLDVIENPNYEHQEIFIVSYDDYIWCIPFIEEEDYIFFKTMYKSRKLKKIYFSKK